MKVITVMVNNSTDIKQHEHYHLKQLNTKKTMTCLLDHDMFIGEIIRLHCYYPTCT